MFLRAPRRGGAGSRAAVPTVSRGCKMAHERRYVSCPSCSKVFHSCFLHTLLNKFGPSVASVRKVYLFRPLFEIAKPLAARMLRVKFAKIARHLAKWS